MRQETSIILWNRPEDASGRYYKIGLTAPAEYESARPGQFATLRFEESQTPLLRRPFSIHGRVEEKGRFAGIQLLYQVVGPFTRRLARAGRGDRVDMLGPLGNGFTAPEGAARLWLVAGGIGVAPLVFLAERLRSAPVRSPDIRAFIGGRTEADLLCREDFKALGVRVTAVTEDGAVGGGGLVTEPLGAALADSREDGHLPDLICACGPMPMLRAVAALAEAHGAPCQISLETIMACGLGACLGCAVTPRAPDAPYQHVCRNGPVFDAGTLSI